MNELGDRNYSLLSQGAKMEGNWLGAYTFCFEQLYVQEEPTIHAFCQWLDDNDKSFGWGNYEDVFQEFLKEGLK